MVSLTLVGFGTSTPRLVTSLTAALNGSSELPVGNVVELQHPLNILVHPGVSSVIYPMAVNPKGFRVMRSWCRLPRWPA